ncbi:hypothetical protein U0070_002054, partial [Myodes glareolus]
PNSALRPLPSSRAPPLPRRRSLRPASALSQATNLGREAKGTSSPQPAGVSSGDTETQLSPETSFLRLVPEGPEKSVICKFPNDHLPPSSCGAYKARGLGQAETAMLFRNNSKVLEMILTTLGYSYGRAFSADALSAESNFPSGTVLARLIKEKDDIDHYLEQNFKGLSKEEVAATHHQVLPLHCIYSTGVQTSVTSFLSAISDTSVLILSAFDRVHSFRSCGFW